MIERFSWFATPVWAVPLPDHERLNDDLRGPIQDLSGQAGVQRSNVGGWHSHNRLHREPAFENLTRALTQAAMSCVEDLHFDHDRALLFIAEMWANRNGPGDSNRAHLHPNSFLSGAYYIDVPEGAGPIEFFDPVIARQMLKYPVKQKTPGNVPSLQYQPAPGVMLLFPAWLYHLVGPNKGPGVRTSISFNFSFQPL